MAQSIVYFRQFASQFNNLDDDTVNGWLNTALVFIDPSMLPENSEKKNLAIALFAAHLAWINKYQGQGGGHRGVIKGEKDDKLSREYIPVDGSTTWLGQSSYGMQYNKLVNSRPIPTILTSKC